MIRTQPLYVLKIFLLWYYLGIYQKYFFIEISWKCSGMIIRMFIQNWFQPIMYCVLPDVIIFLAISGTEYWKAINLCQHLLILITWQVFGNLNLLETNVTVFYFQSVSKEINSASWFFLSNLVNRSSLCISRDSKSYILSSEYKRSSK